MIKNYSDNVNSYNCGQDSIVIIIITIKITITIIIIITIQ